MSWDFLDKLVAKKIAELPKERPKQTPEVFVPNTKFYRNEPIPEYSRLVGVDTETHLITAADPVPSMVCITVFDGVNRLIFGGTTESKIEGIHYIHKLLLEPTTALVGLNGYYDWHVITRAAFDLLGPVFGTTFHNLLYERMRAGFIRELEILARELYIKLDWLRFDPHIGREPQFGLAELVWHWFHVELEGKKGDDVWRLRYAELDGIPVALWPQEAIDYAIMDAYWAQRVYQLIVEMYGNSPDEIFQTLKGFAMSASSVWGMRLDPKKIEELEARLSPVLLAAKTALTEGGFFGGPGDENPTDDKFFDVKRKIAPGFYRRREPIIFDDKIEEYILQLASSVGCPIKRTAGGKISLAKNNIAPLMKDKVVFAYVNKNRALLEKLGFAESNGFVKNVEFIRSTVREWFESRGEDVPMGKISKKKEVTNVKTERDVLRETDDPSLRLLAAIGQFDTVLSTFVPAFKRGIDHGVHPHWTSLVSTGRPSVSNPNLNNQPKLKGVRECFRARDGFVLISADFTQAELCSLAQLNLNLFGFSKMAEAIKAGKDLHSVVGAQLAGVSYEEFIIGLEDGLEEYANFRQLAKVANFGFPGGQGVDSFIRFARKAGVILDAQQVSELKAAWNAAYPEMVSYFRWIKQQIRNSGGERFNLIHPYTNRVRGGVKFTDGCNSGFQGLTADGASNGYIAIDYECRYDTSSVLYGGGVDSWIYDEFLIEVPIERAHEAAERLVYLMKTKMEEFTPDVPAKVEPAVMFNWSKKAKLTRDENGRIIPWELAA